MKKLYCFNCQQEVVPEKFLGFRFCPQCKHRLTDKGDGFYLVCDNCGADNPLSAKKCVKCGYHLNAYEPTETNVEIFAKSKSIKDFVLDFLFVFGAIVFSVIILYISFYLLLVFFVIGILGYFLSRSKFRM